MANYKVVETGDKIANTWIIQEIYCDDELLVRADPNYCMYILQNVMSEGDMYQEVYKSGKSSKLLSYERVSRSWPQQ